VFATAAADRDWPWPENDSWPGWPDFACDSELRLRAFAVADIPDRRGGQDPRSILDRAQADLDGEFGAVTPTSEQLESRPHRAQSHIFDVVLTMLPMPGTVALGHELLDFLADNVVVRVAEERRYLAIGITDNARGIDDDHRIRRRIQGAAGQLGRNRLHAALAGRPYICYVNVAISAAKLQRSAVGSV
jgi:hypothetical protein